MDESTIRRIFEAAPGVLRLGSDTRRSGKRDYFTLRIPVSVAEREYQGALLLLLPKKKSLTCGRLTTPSIPHRPINQEVFNANQKNFPDSSHSC